MIKKVTIKDLASYFFVSNDRARSIYSYLSHLSLNKKYTIRSRNTRVSVCVYTLTTGKVTLETGRVLVGSSNFIAYIFFFVSVFS